MKEKTIYVTVGQFVTALITNSPIAPNSHTQNPIPMKTEEYLMYGYENGWLEDMDITEKNEPLLKKNAARIIHEFLRLEMREPDKEDIRSTAKLRDLYDCRVCAKHVMQVYAKGIMDGYYATDTLYLFGMNDSVSEADMNAIIVRIFRVDRRLFPQD